MFTRRDFLKTTAAGGTAIAVSAFAAPAIAQKKPIKLGYVSPQTGPLAGFGEADKFVIDNFIATTKKLGLSYEVVVKDSQSNPNRAAAVAKELIVTDEVNLVLVSSTPETTNPVSTTCEAEEMPCISTVAPWQPWFIGQQGNPGDPSSWKPFNYAYHFFWGLEDIIAVFTGMWSQIETNKKVGVMYPNDADGNAIRANLAPALAKAGFTIVDPGAYETGTTDFSSQIALFRQEGVEIFNSFPIPPDFAAFWRQAAQQGLTQQIKICQVAKTGLFPSDIEALGDLGMNVSSAAYWHKAFPYKSSLTGVSGNELADGYEAASGKQWTQQLGASLSLLDAGFDVLKAASDVKSKAAVAKAMSTLKTTTIAGKVDFTSGPVANVSPGPIIGTQWVKAPAGSKFALDYVVTEHATDPNVPVGAKLIAYNG